MRDSLLLPALALCTLTLVTRVTAAEPVALRPGVPIHASQSAPTPIRRAIEDLQRDLAKVLGAPSRLTDAPPGGKAPAIVIAGPGEHPQLRRSDVKGFEAHAVFVTPDNQIVLQGEDTRGVIYAIYTFSEAVLGVPPLWFWSTWQPDRRPSIPVSRDLNLVFGPASVKWRAWFPNDQDLLTPWRARSQENFEAFLETMLRLKFNTREGALMDQSSFNEPYSVGREARLVRDRGLVFTGHHVNIFGSSYNHWNDYWRKIRKVDPPPLSVKNVDALREFWRYHIESGLKSDIPTIWQLGFRGSRDIPFWETFADSPATDPERAAMIQAMLALQVRLLKEVTGEAAPLMRATFYNENSDFVAQRLLKPPAEPTLIWVFVAARRDHFPAPDVLNIKVPEHAPVGYYLNFQFTSTGAHLASAEGPWKMEQNYRMVRKAVGRPLTFSVVNAGNIREFLLELSASAAIMWNFDTFDASAFVLQFCSQYFGQSGPEVARLYWRFYDSYWQQQKSDLPGFQRQYLFQDMRYARALEQLLPLVGKAYNPNPLNDRGIDRGGRYFRISPADSGATTQLEAVLTGTGASIKKLEALIQDADQIMATLPPDKRPFFNDHLRVQARFMLEANRTLNSVVQSLQAQQNITEALARIADAEQSAARMRSVLSEAEHGKFSGWYDGDRLFGIARIRTLVHEAKRRLQSPLPEK